MATRVWHVAMVVAAVLAVSGSSADAAAGRPDLIVRIDNYAGVPHGVLSKAKDAVEEIFGAAGVRMGWEGDEDGEEQGGLDQMRLTLLLVKVQSHAARSRSTVLGLAARPSRRAFVFYDRLLDAAAGRSVETSTVLGRVMAHELGHLLLPPGPHARFGLMRGDIELTETSPDRFSDTEVRHLRSAVIRRPVHDRTRSGGS
jgi:hypothetical protein